MTRAVDRIGTRLEHIAEHHVIDPLGFDARLLKRPSRRDSAQLDCGHVLQRAHILRHRRARAAEDQYVCHGVSLSFSTRRRILPDGVRGMASVKCHLRIVL